MPEGQQPGFMYLNIRSNTRVSLAVILNDDYNVKAVPVEDDIKVFIKELPVSPIRNTSGYYVFTNLPEKQYTVCVSSKYYFYEETQVNLEKLNPVEPVLNVKLKPNPSYPFPTNATLIRAMVCDAKGHAAGGAKLRAVPLTGYTAKIASRGVAAGDSELGLVSVARKIFPGDVFLIKNKEDTNREYCVIAGTSENQDGAQVLRLAEETKFAHSKGVTLIPVLESVTDENGEMVLYFRNTFARKFEARIEISFHGQNTSLKTQVVEGTTVSLGSICL